MSRRTGSFLTRGLTILSLLLVSSMIIYLAWLIKDGRAEQVVSFIHHLGVWGIIAGILIQTLLNILPVPGEFFSLLLLEIYGPVWGGGYIWIGGMAGAIGGLLLARWIARPFLGVVKPSLGRIDAWLQRYGDVGLLMVRFAPLVPYHIVNYAAGLLKVSSWGFIWTTALGILPYTFTISLLYAGIRSGTWVWVLVAVAGLTALAIIGFYAKKKNVAMKQE